MSLQSSSPSSVDWDSEESSLLLNPHLPQDERAALSELSLRFAQRAHVWIASSGSSQKTGESLKLIALSKRAFLVAAEAANEHIQATEKDTWVSALPLFHVGGLSIELRAKLSGSKVFSSFHEGRWQPQQFVRSIQDHHGTLSALVPTQVHDLLEQKIAPPSSLRAIIIGGAALPVELYQRARTAGWPLLPSYGLTECCSQVATAELSSLLPTEEAFPRLCVLNHCQVAVDEQGFLKLASPSLLTGYAQKIQQQLIWQTPVKEGWYATSDRVEIERVSEKIYLQPLGRDSDFIKINGEGVSLSRLRGILSRVVEEVSPQAHLDCTLVDIPHARAGAELVLISSTLFKERILEIQQQYNQKVSAIERVHRWVVVDEIPRSALGKIQWEALRLSAMI